MRAPKLASAVAAFALTASLVACGGGPASYGHELLDEAEGIRVTAENADNTHTATTDGAFDLEAGDVIVISPFLEKGSIHVTITSQDGKTVYDDDADGKIMYSVEAEPGSYNVTTTANNATGWMTIFSESSQEIADQDAALVEELKEHGVDEETVEMFEHDDATEEAEDASTSTTD
ncbi:MAG: hypothetical protein J6S63_04905 [Atopobiaceae bacterium]|nr:hypothetical protein [Atopobiaceae bacterium]